MMLVLLVLLSTALAKSSRLNGRGHYHGHHRNLDLRPSLGETFTYTDQLVDHFNPVNVNKWSQRYFVNDTSYVEGGPILFLLGGEGTESERTVDGSSFIFNEWAAALGGVAVCVEHRFYGESFPMDSTDENIYLLSTRQALADFARFRQWFAEERGYTNNQWIVFGGSYSGNLAAWARMMYPHLFTGAIAASAPVWAQEDYPEYAAVVEQSILTFGGETCRAAIASAITDLESLVMDPEGNAWIVSVMGYTQPVGTSALDLGNFFSMMQDTAAVVVQYADEGADPGSIESMCSQVLEGAGNYTENYLNVAVSVGMGGGDPTYQAWVDGYKNAIRPDDEGTMNGRSWFYQTCIEYGYWQTGEGSMFSDYVNLAFFRQFCKDTYGLDFSVPADFTNALFGGRNIVRSNIFYSNGKVDPWHVLSITEQRREDCPTVLMETTSHCADMYIPSPTDPAELTATRDQEFAMIQEWLGIA